MILATDTYYLPGNTAKTVGILFESWTEEVPGQVIDLKIEQVAEYEPGFFYKRELPCIEALLAQCDLQRLEVIVVDGYVYLDDQGRAGLGAHLYRALDGRIPVIGVAKTRFHDNTVHVREILRGESLNPLFISSIGIPVDMAASWVLSMYGPYRMPHLLKLLDGYTRVP